MSLALRAEGVRKTYDDGARRVDVLRGVDLEVAAGELTAIVGPSGSGKSTLLHLLGGLDLPDEGSIQIGEENTADLGPEALARLRNEALGFVFQFHRLLPDFDALENVMLPGRIARRPTKEVEERARQLLVEVGLEDRLDHFPNQLSGGERQRVAICRALALEPPILLADEPTGNLDPENADKVFDLLLEMRARHGTTAVLVTHNPELAARCGSVRELVLGRLDDADPSV